MNEASANAHSLYSVVLMPAASAAGSLCRIAAQARPGLVFDVGQDQHEHENRDDDRVAEVGRVAGRDARPADRRDVDQAAVVTGEAVAAVREVHRGQHHGDRTGQHQRDQGQVQAAQPQRGQPDRRARHHGDQTRLEQDHRVGLGGGEQQPGGHPGADGQHRDLAQGDQADPADQHPEGQRDHRVHGHLGHGVDVVQAEQLRQAEQGEEQQHRDDAEADELGAAHWLARAPQGTRGLAEAEVRAH